MAPLGPLRILCLVCELAAIAVKKDFTEFHVILTTLALTCIILKEKQ
jgi:hypothetical protein